MKIFIGADHKGFYLKDKIISYLRSRGYNVVDEGDKELNSDDDFTVFAGRVVGSMLSDSDSQVRGVLICGSGQGMAMAANRHKGIRAGLGWSVVAARETRNDEDSNVLALPAEILNDDKQWQDILDTWLATPFSGAVRHKRRNQQLDDLV